MYYRTTTDATRRNLTNFAALIRRAETGKTGATDEGSGRNFAASQVGANAYVRAILEALVKIEDAEGVDAAAKLSDRFTDLRQRAVSAGLVTVEQVFEAERAALEA